MRISDWSSDVCSSDLTATGPSAATFVSNSAGRAMAVGPIGVYAVQVIFVGSAEKSRNRKRMIDSQAAFPYPPFRYEAARLWWPFSVTYQIGRASCRDRVCQYV